MKALDVTAVVIESMTHYLESKSYNDESFINYVARDTRAHGDKFTAEDRSICVKVAKETIEQIIVAFDNNREQDYTRLSNATFYKCITGVINDYELGFICKCSKKDFMQVFNSGYLSEHKKFAKSQLTKAFLGK